MEVDSGEVVNFIKEKRTKENKNEWLIQKKTEKSK